MDLWKNDFGMTYGAGIGQDGYGQKMPFYMTYPMQNVYLQEEAAAQDRLRLQYMYPQEVRKIQHYVEEACDRMEYEGSLMYDVHPDQLLVRRLCKNIYRKMMPEAEGWKDDSMFHMIQVMLCHEIFQRRCRYRQSRGWY